MFDRRTFLARSLKTSSLVALGATVPGFVTRTARAAAPGKETVLVVLEMTGGNDGLNTVVPYADDLYHKARPTLRFTKEQVVKVDDHIGLHPALRPLERMLKEGQMAVVQGVGYPNPDRSHFESMDIWQSADVKRQIRSGWLGRGLGGMKFSAGAVPGVHVGTEQLPLALAGASTGVPSIHPSRPYDLELDVRPFSGNPNTVQFSRFNPNGMPAGPSTEPHHQARRKLIEDLASLPPGSDGSLYQFVQRSQVQTYANVERLRKIMEEDLKMSRTGRVPGFAGNGELARNLSLVGQMINADFGTRVFYLSISGFDTHSEQQRQHEQLLGQIATALSGFFEQLKQGGNAERVLLMTFSEFGRRVQENGSKGTDHGAGSCLFVVGPGAKGGAVGKHPSLADLDNGDLRHHTDFRSVYAALLSGWLGCDARTVLGGRFDSAPVLKKG
ncbi:MAG TPA: DUF1501 domain-containing protein [Fimbriiglobus sp.]|nr:DUF1501 domain-containing protein [Fimbriiglobus sp.]